jgi:hypothetical protein
LQQLQALLAEADVGLSARDREVADLRVQRGGAFHFRAQSTFLSQEKLETISVALSEAQAAAMMKDELLQQQGLEAPAAKVAELQARKTARKIG